MKRIPLRSTLASFCRLAPLLVPLLASCGSGGGDNEGGDCQVCRSTEPKCDEGLTCSRFEGNFSYALCAKPNTNKCPVPF
jgi:hypothetical protein